ncbi:Uncharacterized protein pbN1_41500 [Aromatoleum bremense]|nr:Uncharacterized protein pbN1_41500 [Aromatoleum bremense]
MSIEARVALRAKRHDGGPKDRTRDCSGECLANQSPCTGDHSLKLIGVSAILQALRGAT